MRNPFKKPIRMPIPTQPMSDASVEILKSVDPILDAKDREPDFKSTLKTLNAIPKDERNLDWVERVVTLHVLTDMKPLYASKMNNKLAAARRRAGETDRFETFAKQLEAKLAPYRMTLHGKVLPFKNRDCAPILTELQELFKFLNDNDFPTILNSGTLLGAVREGSFLPHDDDIDLAVMVKGDTMEERIKELSRLGRLVDADTISATPVEMRTATPMLAFEFASGVGVDLFPLWVNDGRAFIWPHTYGDLSADQVFPLGSAAIDGVELPAPSDPHAMLAVNYGPDWQSPDSLFRFNWSEASKRFSAELDAHVKSQRTFTKRVARLFRRRNKP